MCHCAWMRTGNGLYIDNFAMIYQVACERRLNGKKKLANFHLRLLNKISSGMIPLPKDASHWKTQLFQLENAILPLAGIWPSVSNVCRFGNNKAQQKGTDERTPSKKEQDQQYPQKCSMFSYSQVDTLIYLAKS